MKEVRVRLTYAFVGLLFIAGAIASLNAQSRDLRRRVPDVVGLPYADAESLLSSAGFKYKLTELDEPDASVPIGHIKGSIPAQGTLVRPGLEVELLMPRAATRVGIGALSLSDIERRAGFDLDEGRYEEVYRGADIVLRHHDPETFINKATGRPYNNGGKGIYLEPSDGTLLARSDSNYSSLGSLVVYAVCQAALKGPTRQLSDKVEILVDSVYGSTICALTSKNQIAVIEFRYGDNRTGDNYEFHYAIFPGPPTVRAVARAKSDEGTGQPISICEAARQARARNSPATAGLEAQCRAAGAVGETPPFNLDDLAARGQTIAAADALATELRNQQSDDARRGFDIGMAAAEGQTAPGPGKQKVHDALGGTERRAFDIAVAFSLERNRNADLAAKGAAIAAQDESLTEVRMAEADVFYRLGFDIATGIFGDPALGARGNTALGPGSLKVRDSLSPAGQRGFDASVRLHLSRNYKQ